jgi:hypothetical protein
MSVTNQTIVRKDTAANWTSSNPTLVSGVFGIESDTGYIKKGDGSTAWTSIAYTDSADAPINVVVPAGLEKFAGADGFASSSVGFVVSISALNASKGRVFKGSGTMAAPNMGDGYGICEIELDISGSPTGHSAASSSWVNINAGTVPPGNYICARNDGIYEAAAATITNAKIIFGARMHYLCDDTDSLRFPFSINTNNAAITALIDCNNFSDLGAASGKSIQATFVPFLRNAAGTIMYLPLYA